MYILLKYVVDIGTLLKKGRWLKMATQKKRIQISLTEYQIELLGELAKKKGFSKSAILALALEEYSRKELEQKK